MQVTYLCVTEVTFKYLMATLLFLETLLLKQEFRLKDKTREWLIFSVCLVCIFLFLYTGYSKIEDHVRFMKGLSKVRIIGGMANYIAWLVPIAEIIIAVMMIIPKTYRFGLHAFTGLMSVFTVYIISMLLWAEKLPCHCGGAIEKLTWTQHVWFNLAFIAIAIYALWLSNRKTTLNIKK